jgi:hypothetical protein
MRSAAILFIGVAVSVGVGAGPLIGTGFGHLSVLGLRGLVEAPKACDHTENQAYDRQPGFSSQLAVEPAATEEPDDRGRRQLDAKSTDAGKRLAAPV